MAHFDTILLGGAGRRLGVAALGVAALWLGVWWVRPVGPLVQQPLAAAAGVAEAVTPAVSAASQAASIAGVPALRAVVTAGQPAPGGGTFDRFDVDQQPIVAPVNARGQVAFYARLVRAKQAEGMFLASGKRIVKIAGVGDPIPGGGRLAQFAHHPLPSLNASGKIAFGAGVAGGNATEGIFLGGEGSLRAIALSGADAPGIVGGTFLEFDAPVLNDNEEIAFLATVRRPQGAIQVLYLYRAGKLVRLVSEGDVFAKGGTFDKFGAPAMNQKGVIAFAATLDRGPVLGGIFVAGTRDLSLMLGAGQTTTNGDMLVRFSEHLAIDEDDVIALGAHLNVKGAEGEAVFTASLAGLTRIAALGDAAPGGGQFAAFGPWPGIGPQGSIVFVAAVDKGPGPVGLFVSRAGKVERVAMVGDVLSGGSTLAAFAINPTPSAGPNGGMTFATMAADEAGRSTIYYYGPPGVE